jgi:hypothetical protein
MSFPPPKRIQRFFSARYGIRGSASRPDICVVVSRICRYCSKQNLVTNCETFGSISGANSAAPSCFGTVVIVYLITSLTATLRLDFNMPLPFGSYSVLYTEFRRVIVFGRVWCNVDVFKADSHIACRAHAVPLPCLAAKGLECVFPI